MSTDSNLDIVKTVVANKKNKIPTKSTSDGDNTGKSRGAAAGEASDAQIVQAVKDVAAELGGDAKQTESELLAKLRKSTDGGQQQQPLRITDLISGMQIDHMNGAKTNAPPKRSAFVRKSIASAQERRGGGDGAEAQVPRGTWSNADRANHGDRGRPFQRRKPASESGQLEDV